VAERGLVLVVGDDDTNVRGLREILEGEHYAVTTILSIQGARDLLARMVPDVVLIDTDLCDAGPFDLLAELKARDRTQDVPVIFVATQGDADVRLRGLESGDDLIVKPIDPREVLTRIERQVTVSKVRMALRESEAKFRSVMESAIDAIISADAEGRIRSWNTAAAALFGRTEDEVIGQPLEVIIPERFREAHRAGVHRVTTGGPSHVIGKTVELAAIRSDGSEFPVELSLATWFLDQARYYTGIIRDISERKQAEEKFRSVTESAIDAIISADHTGEIITWNKAATNILGWTEEEAVGKRLELVIPERFHDAHRAGIARFTATGEAHVIGKTVELAACRKDGVELPIELSLSTWTVRDARYYTGIIRDIGERKRAEEAIRLSEQSLRERSEELRGKNEALEETLRQLNEMQDQLIMQEKMASLGKLSAGMAHELNNPAASAQRGAAQLRETFSRWQEVQLQLNELRLDADEQTALEKLDGVAQDRARRPVELNAVARADREAELEDWLDDRRVAHAADLAPSLVSLGLDQAELEELCEDFRPEQLPVVVEWLGYKFVIYSLFAEILVGTARIVELVKALKTYTYMDQAPLQEVDVRDGLDNTLIILHSKLKKGVNVVRDYAEDLPAVHAFAGELNQVWTNLIDNAIDAMDGEGTLVVRTRRDGDSVVVEIEDDGPGIPDDVVTKIFDPFFTTKAPGQGTGLGLNISRNLITRRHHGSLTVSSEPGHTRFTIRLPIDVQPEAPDGA
jgi:PAS domain S-box-containing protein